MTAFNARSKGFNPRGNNKKDGAIGRRRARQNYEAHGFTLVEPPSKLSYTWQGVFPVFSVKPGIVNGLEGIVAQCGETIEWFPYGTDYQVIKDRLDDLILEIVRHDADIDGQPLDWEPAGEWIDIDAFMAVR